MGYFGEKGFSTLNDEFENRKLVFNEILKQ